MGRKNKLPKTDTFFREFIESRLVLLHVVFVRFCRPVKQDESGDTVSRDGNGAEGYTQRTNSSGRFHKK